MDTEKLLEFARQHSNVDPLKLLLQRKRYPDIDMTAVAQQIEGRHQASAKWPTLDGCDHFLYPPRLNREQSSSETTARNKRVLIDSLFNTAPHALSVADLTGGMGIDSIFFAEKTTNAIHSTQVDYIELDAELCRLMEHNKTVLGLANINIHCGDCMDWLSQSGRHYNIIFIDPARRDTKGRKVTAFEDCTPNILEHKTHIMQHCDKLMVKASPMMDIDKGVAQLGNVSDVFVVSVNGECKELLFICGDCNNEPTIHCQNILPGKRSDCYSFTRSQESAVDPIYSIAVGRYIYEPDASLMKGGPYKLLSQQTGLRKLARNTHLYTSDEELPWTGRIFHVLKKITLSRKVATMEIPDRKAHVVVRNYPTTASELQKQLGLSEGGDLFVIATTVGIKKAGFLCRLQKSF